MMLIAAKRASDPTAPPGSRSVAELKAQVAKLRKELAVAVPAVAQVQGDDELAASLPGGGEAVKPNVRANPVKGSLGDRYQVRDA